MEPTMKIRKPGRNIHLFRREVSLCFFCTISKASNMVSPGERLFPRSMYALRVALYALTARGG